VAIGQARRNREQTLNKGTPMVNDPAPKTEDDSKKVYKRKLKHILRDREATLATNGRFGVRIMSNKGWSITVVLAYIGYTTTSYENPNDIPWLVLPPLFATVLLFWVMEGYYRGQSIYNRKTVFCTVDAIFLKESEASFWDAVKEYKFLSDPPKPKTLRDKLLGPRSKPKTL